MAVRKYESTFVKMLIPEYLAFIVSNLFKIIQLFYLKNKIKNGFESVLTILCYGSSSNHCFFNFVTFSNADDEASVP